MLSVFIFATFVNCGTTQLISGGKYRLDISRISQCPEHPNNKLPSPLEARYVKFNRTTKVLNANYTLARDMDEKFAVELILQKWSDGGWKNDLLHMKVNDACRQYLRYLKSFWVDFLKHFDVKEPEKCPIKKGVYRTRNYILPLDLIQMNFFLGSFNIKVLQWRESVIHTCVLFYFDVIENI